MNEVRNHNICGGHSCTETNTNNVNKTSHALILPYLTWFVSDLQIVGWFSFYVESGVKTIVMNLNTGIIKEVSIIGIGQCVWI
jgi:hypothetical protein